MATLPDESSGLSGEASTIEPFFCLLSAVLLLSTVPTVTKYVFQHSTVDPLGMALIRVTTGFFFLLAITLAKDRRGLSAMTAGDIFQLTLLGSLGVGSYVIAAWGLRLTSVTHYILIYSLVSPLTAFFSIVLRKSHGSPLRVLGIIISLAGCGIAMAEKLANFQADFGLGDLLILLFTVMMAAHLVGSVNIVKRFGANTANTVMFGSSALLLMVVDAVLDDPPSVDLSVSMVSSLLYIGVATASVFLLRYRALQSICPATVAVYQNLAPVGGILVAHLYLGEIIQLSTMVGGAIILVGAELVRSANQPGLPASYLWAKRCLGSLVGRTSP
jgi:drug/metabolite transporter (DMT)-like permease